MLQQFRREQTDLHNISINEIRRQIGMGILTMFAVVGILFDFVTTVTGVTLQDDPSYTGVIVGVISAIAAFMLWRKILIEVALYLPLVTLFAIFMILQADQTFLILFYTILIYAAIITRLPIFSIVNVMLVLAGISRQPISADFSYIIVTFSALPIGGIVFYVVNNFTQITSAVGRTNRLLQGNSNVAQIINQELELQQLLDSTVNIVREEFNFYHVQVFLMDEAHTHANLIASTGEAGRQLLARNHRLPVGSQSVIGRVTQIGEPVVTQNTRSDTIHAINELLPNTQAEVALPIIDAGNIIGALDVQSVNLDAFQPIDVQALQIIANQLAVAIRNARLFDQAQQNINENKRLVFEYETNLREVDRLNRTLTKQSWDSYLTQSFIDGVTLSKDRFIPKADWSDAMRAATVNRQTNITSVDDTSLITVPIILRGQVLGAIEVEVDGNKNTSDSAELIQAISQRLAISLESARLFEETQEATLQEQQINEIVTSYETAVTIDELLQVTLEKLQQSLGAEKGTIRLGTLDKNNTSPHTYNGNGGSPS